MDYDDCLRHGVKALRELQKYCEGLDATELEKSAVALAFIQVSCGALSKHSEDGDAYVSQIASMLADLISDRVKMMLEERGA